MVNRILLSIIGLSAALFCLFAAPNVFAQNTAAPVTTEQIEDFHANIDLAKDGIATVTESIVYNFGTLQRHGIERIMPYHYSRSGGSYNVRINVLSVTDEKGNPITYAQTRWLGSLTLKIGDKNVLVTGIHTYVITYRIQRVINFFASHDEFYWNVTGNGWPVPINNASTIIKIPQALKPDQINTECFTGALGSNDHQCSSTVVDAQTVVFNSETPLLANHGLTLVLGLPGGTITQPTAKQKWEWFLADNWPVFVPLIILVFMMYLWNAYGRDPKDKNTLIPFYTSPDNLPAAEIGTIVDEKADIKDISASIIQLAIKGYLKIKEIEEKKLIGNSRDYDLIKLKEPDANLRDYEKLVLGGIFDGVPVRSVSDLKNKFYKTLPLIKTALYSSIVNDGYFPTNPEKVRNSYLGIGAAVIVVGGFLMFGFQNIVSGMAFLISGVIIGLFGRIMPRKTMKGANTHLEILGFKWFLSVTQKDRLAFHDAPAKSPKEFEELLPYAMVLGVEKEWAKQFEGIYLTPPDWYEGNFGNAFGAWYLVGALNSMSSNMNSAMVATPHQNTAGFGGSGFGGGFSGGGFGGGGGGSW